MTQKNPAEHHTKAAEHTSQASHHHKEAAKHYTSGSHEKAAHPLLSRRLAGALRRRVRIHPGRTPTRPVRRRGHPARCARRPTPDA